METMDKLTVSVPDPELQNSQNEIYFPILKS